MPEWSATDVPVRTGSEDRTNVSPNPWLPAGLTSPLIQ